MPSCGAERRPASREGLPPRLARSGRGGPRDDRPPSPVTYFQGGPMAGQENVRSDPVADRLAGLGASPGLIIGAGVLSIIIGLLVLVWPGYSVVVLAWLFA